MERARSAWFSGYEPHVNVKPVARPRFCNNGCREEYREARIAGNELPMYNVAGRTTHYLDAMALRNACAACQKILTTIIIKPESPVRRNPSGLGYGSDVGSE